MLKKVLIGLVVFFVVVMVIGSFTEEDGTQKSVEVNTEEVAKEAEVAKEEVIEVKASEIATAYQKNEIKADKQYKDKTLLVTAIIESIDSGIGDKAVLQLRGADFITVSANGADDTFTEKASELEKGQEIKLLCIGDGEMIGFPSLKDCVIQ